ncbi:hypothetical protein K1719_040419 [Acacia pycnantha]|nr:hypothetical protein K1719_040419 [Acacia pycnantha]
MDRLDRPASSAHWPGTERSLMSDDDTKGVQYDVFLSFRSEDTQASFTSHLYSSLSNAGILVFKADDTDLRRGNSISTELNIVIECSIISIIIFSKYYASSRWCLDELSKIMELHRAQGRIVLPVFYDVDPYDVRCQVSHFGKAFRDFIQRSSPKEEEVSRWRTDLCEATNILGFVVIKSRNESEEIKNIVECVCEILNKKNLFIANHPIEVNSRMQDVIKMSESHPQGSKYDKAWYDVFLSFRGEDTRTSFTAHLYSSLSNAGILVFKEDANHLKGLDITELRRAIESSTISIIIFSRDYASSPWCLRELSMIMELHRAQHRVVLPVFYGVEPSSVRHQTSNFGEAFKHLIRGISPTEVEVSKWRTDLHDAGSLSGFDMHYYRNESDIENIVKRVCQLLDKKDFFICKHPVGVKSRMQELIRMSESHSPNHVLVLGIQGMGGTGKTVIAKAVYNEIGPNFVSKTFLSNIREIWEQDHGPVCLQQQLLSEICKTTKMKIQCNESGKNILKKGLRHKQALIVLDDVDKVEQLNALSGSDKWFGPGSRIIITTRDEHLLRFLNVDADHVYRVTNMDQSESIELFSWHAFRQPSPKEGFIEISRNIVDYSGGVPLALEVLGCYLLDREATDWEIVLDKLRKIPNDQIQKKLKISFDGLNDDMEREIFLDISCLFIGMDRNDVTRILNARGFFADIGISVLVERSLVTVDEKNKLGMHDLLRDMGREIVCEKSPKPSARYDVFLSFRGEDTRASFISHLSSSLSNDEIVVFKDDTDLPRGNNISLELQRGIENSTISIVIFSKDYAGSRWCLNELSKIMEVHRVQGRVVLPVFYGVDPSAVRNQISSFGKAFQDLIQRSSPTHDQVLRWRTDLREAGGIAGFVVLNSRNESEDIKNIVEHVCEVLDKKDLFIPDHPVGLDSRVQDLIEMSRNHPPNDVLVLGIWGMGGIGKTVIAKAMFNKSGRIFESRSFLSNIREVWKQDGGPINLQQQLVSDIYKATKIKIRCVESGKNILKERLGQRRAFVVLDDVDKVEQLNALSGSVKWFGPGSMIIITTRDEHLLRFLNVDTDHVYRVMNMDKSESIELFSWHAFRQPSPREGFVELSRNIVAYSGGLPLALEILGCYLFEREATEWKSVLEKLKKIPNDQILKKLKISFDGLNDDMEKEIFLDISCFFIGMDRNDVTQILNASGFFADIGISVLVKKSLVTVDEKNKLDMHDLLRDMGREIIRERSPKDFGKRSRLWFHEDVIDVLSKHTGTESIEGLALNLSQDNKVFFSTKAFNKMNKLRLLRLVNVELDGDYKYISRDLKWLCWHKFPLKYVPANFFQNNLVAIELKYSSLRLWRETQLLENLKMLNLSHSPYLVCTPDFSKLPNLEKLILKDCPSLSMIHYTIGQLDKLHMLNLKDCIGLHGLPKSIYKLKCLKTLILSGCLKIEKLEEDIEQMDSLSTLIADNTAITQVPISLVRSKSIGYISICGYQGLARHVFPSLIWSRMSPTNNPLFLVPTHAIMPPSISSSNILNDDAAEVNEGATKILDSLCASSCRDLATMSNTSKILEIESSLLTDNNHSQVGTSSQDKCLRHLLIHIGNNDQVTSSISECILQGLTLRDDHDDCVIPGDEYPYWQCFKSEGAFVKFKVPLVYSSELKGMTVCCEYYPSCDLSNVEYDSFISMLIINYTKMTTLDYRRDTLTSIKEAKWKEIISNLDSDNQVEIKAIFANGFTVKRTTVYLKYYESFHEQMEDPASSSNGGNKITELMRWWRKKDEVERARIKDFEVTVHGSAARSKCLQVVATEALVRLLRW